MFKFKKRWVITVMVLSITFLIAACSADQDDAANDPGNDQANSGHDSDVQAMIDEGKEAYAKSCIGCHGANLEGTSSGVDLTNLDLSREEIIDVIKNGQGTMPPNLAPNQEAEIAEYLLSEQS